MYNGIISTLFLYQNQISKFNYHSHWFYIIWHLSRPLLSISPLPPYTQAPNFDLFFISNHPIQISRNQAISFHNHQILSFWPLLSPFQSSHTHHPSSHPFSRRKHSFRNEIPFFQEKWEFSIFKKNGNFKFFRQENHFSKFSRRKSIILIFQTEKSKYEFIKTWIHQNMISSKPEFRIQSKKFFWQSLEI